jgi:phage gp29-like protein
MAKVTKSKQTPGNLIIQNTVITQIQRQQIDIGKWRNALKSAESITNPNRTALYDIYSDIELDTHLTSVMSKRKAAILKKKIIFERDGKEDEAVMAQIESPWFHRFMNDLLDTIGWGHSLFQFYKEGDWIAYDLIPRKHVKPEKGIITKNQSDQDGLLYRDGQFPNVLEVKYYTALGLLVKAAPWVIYKRNGVGDFAQFAEIFGQPMREGIYDGYDDEARKKLVSDLTAAASSPVFVHAQGTEVKIIDTPFKASSVGIYDKLIEVCNAELSKLILGNTLTTQQGENGARSLGDVHKEGEEDINITDEQFVSDTLNYDMTDIFANLGINTAGGVFTINEPTSIDLTQRIAVDIQVANKVPVSDDYFYETYGIPKPDNYEELKRLTPVPSPNGEGSAPNNGSEPTPPPPGGGREGVTNKLRTFYDIYGHDDEGFWNKFFSFFVKPRR